MFFTLLLNNTKISGTILVSSASHIFYYVKFFQYSIEVKPGWRWTKWFSYLLQIYFVMFSYLNLTIFVVWFQRKDIHPISWFKNLLLEIRFRFSFCRPETNKIFDYYTWNFLLFASIAGWFQDMSSLFLSCRVPKLLILAGIIYLLLSTNTARNFNWFLFESYFSKSNGLFLSESSLTGLKGVFIFSTFSPQWHCIISRKSFVWLLEPFLYELFLL